MLLCYTGATRRSDHIIEDQTARFEGRDEDTLEGLRRQKDFAVEMKNALLRGRTDAFGDLLHQAWEAKKKLSPRIATPFIDEAYEAAKQHGALGGKVTGAGGGGFMLFYCVFERKHEVADALARLGATVSEFAFEPNGLETWTIPDS
jgi:D-glycero-alpha-D-manno-heptose-7-phosphate kinase